MSTTPSTTTATPTRARRDNPDGFTSATPTVYIGTDGTIHAYRCNDGDLQIDITNAETGAHVASIRLTSDKAEAAFLGAIKAVTA